MIPRLYLIPGFFGFSAFGELHYFHHVKEALDRIFKSRGEDVQVHRIETLPTSSITRRAERLREVLRETAGEQGPIYLVGHSTGAMDARQLLCPDRIVEQDEPILRRVRSVVSVAGAHRGTPLANAFRTAFGKELLRLLAVMSLRTLKMGPLPVSALTGLAALLGALDDVVGAKPDLIDQVKAQLLDELTPERRNTLQSFFMAIAEDQDLLDELTPERAKHFDAQTHNRPGVRYACVVTEARRPSLSSVLEQGLSPYAQASHALYHAIYRITGSGSFEVTKEAEDARPQLTASLGDMPDSKDSDGIVPTLSQFHGRLLRAVKADHHDIIGNFDGQAHDPPHVDWLLTGTGFDRGRFEAVWTDVADFLLEGTLTPRASFSSGE